MGRKTGDKERGDYQKKESKSETIRWEADKENEDEDDYEDEDEDEY